MPERDDAGEARRAQYAADALRWRAQAATPPAAAEVDATIAETRHVLGQVIPEALPERLLRRPPVKYIHAVFATVHAATGFGGGLFAEEGPPRSRAEKIKFLVNLVACVSLVLGEGWIVARCAPNLILSGADVLGANMLLQNLARAALRGASDDAVRHVKAAGEEALYQRSISVRRAVVRAQGKARGDICRRRRLLVPPPVVQATAAELEARLRKEYRRKLGDLNARKKHLEVQEVLLADKDELIRKRETRVKRMTDRARSQLKKLEKQKQDWEEHTLRSPADSDGNSTINSVQTFRSRTSFRRGASVDSGASAKTTATVAGTGARYARAARTRAKKRAKKKVNREIRLAGDLDVARGALSQTPSGEINRCMRALGGTRGVFGAFLREQLVEVKAEIALMPEARPRAAPTADEVNVAFPLPLAAPRSEFVHGLEGFGPPADLGLASVARFVEERPFFEPPGRQDGFARRPDAEERPTAMGRGFEPPERPDAKERPPATGLDGFEPPGRLDADERSLAMGFERPDAEERPPAMGLDGFTPSTAAPPDASDGDYCEDDFDDDYDDVFDADDIAADEAEAAEPRAEPSRAEPTAEPSEEPAAAVAELGYADGAADEARAFLDRARERRGVPDMFREPAEPARDNNAADAAAMRAAEAGALRDVVAQLRADTASQPSTAVDSRPSSSDSSGDYDYPVDSSTAQSSPARRGAAAGGEVASPPAREEEDWFSAPEQPKPARAPVATNGYLSKFDADFERSMAKHRAHL